ncbi:hypothetical protein [Pseudoxanthomonas sp. UTMC 1351]|uniref:hypothetical protein n=1 Tax=Pseudoxanthomonas sp. UTMC 1351 TaxID=2695853 RepID=UPI0034CDCD8F
MEKLNVHPVAQLVCLAAQLELDAASPFRIFGCSEKNSRRIYGSALIGDPVPGGNG